MPGGQPPPPPSDGQSQVSQDQYAAYWAQIQSNPEYAAYVSTFSIHLGHG